MPREPVLMGDAVMVPKTDVPDGTEAIKEALPNIVQMIARTSDR